MWSLVDYNTMSSAPKVRQTYNPDVPHIMDASLQQWLDLFSSHEMETAASAEFSEHVNIDRIMGFLDESYNNGSISFADPPAEGRNIS